jgi:hypothetical protein
MLVLLCQPVRLEASAREQIDRLQNEDKEEEKHGDAKSPCEKQVAAPLALRT